MVIHFFWDAMKDDSESEDFNATVQEIAGELILPPSFPFTHKDCDKLDPACNFRSDFILKLITTAHLSKTTSAIDVQSLETTRLQKGFGMECIVALVAAVVKFYCVV